MLSNEQIEAVAAKRLSLYRGRPRMDWSFRGSIFPLCIFVERDRRVCSMGFSQSELRDRETFEFFLTEKLNFLLHSGAEEVKHVFELKEEHVC